MFRHSTATKSLLLPLVSSTVWTFTHTLLALQVKEEEGKVKQRAEGTNFYTARRSSSHILKLLKNSFKSQVSIGLIARINGVALLSHGRFSIVYTHISLGNWENAVVVQLLKQSNPLWPHFPGGQLNGHTAEGSATSGEGGRSCRHCEGGHADTGLLSQRCTCYTALISSFQWKLRLSLKNKTASLCHVHVTDDLPLPLGTMPACHCCFRQTSRIYSPCLYNYLAETNVLSYVFLVQKKASLIKNRQMQIGKLEKLC